jgi:hypothetical protein
LLGLFDGDLEGDLLGDYDGLFDGLLGNTRVRNNSGPAG